MKTTPRGWWFDGAAIAVALAAAIALTVTVLVARRELDHASIAMVRGEGEALATQLHDLSSRHTGPPSEALLGAQLRALRPAGLRFIELPMLGLTAGESRIPHSDLRPGSVVVRGGRALLVNAIPGPPRRHLVPVGVPRHPPLLVIEYEPLVISRVHAGMDYTLGVAGASALVLLALAGVLTLRAVRRTSLDRRAAQEKRLALLGQMAGVMAHELRNPLTSLKGHAQLLEEMLAAGSREQNRAALVVAEAVRLERLTQDLLAFVRDGAPAVRAVAPAALLERALRDFPRGRVEVDLASAPAELYLDEARVAVAIGNLVQNAIQATSAESPVGVSVVASGAEVIIDVRDAGAGVTPGDEERVFEPFYTTRIHGTGLGLAVARRAVEEQGGTLRFEPTATGASVFRLRLPASRARVAASDG